MNDLRTASKQALECLKGVARGKYDGNAAEMCAALEAALAQQAEPVPFGCVTVRRLSLRHENHADQYQFWPAGQSPYLDNVDECHKVYTAPPQRKPLTEEEIEACRQQGYAHAGLSAPFDFGKAARAIERAHNITDTQIADRLARHGIPMPEGDPK